MTEHLKTLVDASDENFKETLKDYEQTYVDSGFRDKSFFLYHLMNIFANTDDADIKLRALSRLEELEND